MKRLLLIPFVWMALLLAGWGIVPAQAADPPYTVIYLGDGFEAVDINNNSQIVGWVPYPFDSKGRSGTAIWQNGSIQQYILAGLIQSSTYPPPVYDTRVHYTRGASINDKGQVVGEIRYYYTEDDGNGNMVERGYFYAFLWDKGNFTALTPARDDSGESVAVKINNVGTILGRAWLVISTPDNVYGWAGMVTWRNGVPESLKLYDYFNFPDWIASYPFLDGKDINDKGVIVGTLSAEYNNPPDQEWRYGGIYLPFRTDGTNLHFLPTLGEIDKWISANAINNQGIIVGESTLDSNDVTHACLWNGDIVQDLHADLNNVPSSSFAKDINNATATQIVGYTSPLEAGEWKALLWQKDPSTNKYKMFDLNQLIPKDSGWILQQAIAINDRGEIIARGKQAGLPGYGVQCFLLRPSSGPVFKIDNAGNVYADGTYQSPAKDFAELWPVGNLPEGETKFPLEPGDLLALDSDGRVVPAGLQKSSQPIGVYATRPGMLGGGVKLNSLENESHNKIPVAMIGIVPVKVSNENGPISPGDLLAASAKRPGYAARAKPVSFLGRELYPAGSFIGKAMEACIEERGVINMLIISQ